VSNALSKYLNGQQLTAQEQAIVNIALQRFSVPPEGILPVVTTPPQQTSRDIAKSVLDGIFGGNFTDQIARLNDPHSSVAVAFNTWSSRLDSGMTPEAMKAAVLSGPTYQTWVHNNTANPTPAATPAPAPASAAPHNYTIQPGDTLSAIANRFYGAPDWQRIYAANSAVIGGNPNLIHPGQTITIPA
jgi:LysM repeat protein